MVASAFTILSLFASWKSLEAAKKANKWAYYSYQAALVQIRVSLLQLCVDPPVSSFITVTVIAGSVSYVMLWDMYKATCDLVHTWNYLPSVYDAYHPDGMQQTLAVPRPAQRKMSDTTVVVACFGAVLAAVPLVAAAVLAGGWIRRKLVGTNGMV
jgi:hypothetical protein